MQFTVYKYNKYWRNCVIFHGYAGMLYNFIIFHLLKLLIIKKTCLFIIDPVYCIKKDVMNIEKLTQKN